MALIVSPYMHQNLYVNMSINCDFVRYFPQKRDVYLKNEYWGPAENENSDNHNQHWDNCLHMSLGPFLSGI